MSKSNFHSQPLPCNRRRSLFSRTFDEGRKADLWEVLIEEFSAMSEPLEASSAAPFTSTGDGEIPSFNGDEKAKASDFANYFCSYAQLHHQKQMLADHNRMAAYHSAILGNPDVFKDKVVMDIGTGSGILAIWAAQAGARKVYASESFVTVGWFLCVDMASFLPSFFYT